MGPIEPMGLLRYARNDEEGLAMTKKGAREWQKRVCDDSVISIQQLVFYGVADQFCVAIQSQFL